MGDDDKAGSSAVVMLLNKPRKRESRPGTRPVETTQPVIVRAQHPGVQALPPLQRPSGAALIESHRVRRRECVAPNAREMARLRVRAWGDSSVVWCLAAAAGTRRPTCPRGCHPDRIVSGQCL
jgi:hypothetical protein